MTKGTHVPADPPTASNSAEAKAYARHTWSRTVPEPAFRVSATFAPSQIGTYQNFLHDRRDLGKIGYSSTEEERRGSVTKELITPLVLQLVHHVKV
jgi:hypothetical protein